METRDQKYAKAAFPKVNGQKNAATEKGYRTVALGFPVMVLQSGLVQAAGFLLAKNGPEHQAYLRDLSSILGFTSGQDFHTKLVDSQLAEYQLLTRKALEAASWLKRYTQSLLSGDGEG